MSILRRIRFNKGSGLSPDVVVPPTTETHSLDGAYRKAVELLTHG
jgi:hypothetical protein